MITQVGRQHDRFAAPMKTPVRDAIDVRRHRKLAERRRIDSVPRRGAEQVAPVMNERRHTAAHFGSDFHRKRIKFQPHAHDAIIAHTKESGKPPQALTTR